MKAQPSDSLALARTCCQVLDDKKAGDLRVLDVREQSSITNYLVLATGTSDPHLRALRVELEKTLDAAGVRILGMDAARESGWLVIDAFDVMVHLFLAEPRRNYALENLWKDAAEVDVAALLKPPAVAKPKAKPARKRAVSATAKKKAVAKPRKPRKG